MPISITLSDINNFNDDQENHLNESALLKLGGLRGLELKLATDFQRGISGSQEDVQQRKSIFGQNEFPEPVSQSWLDLFIESFEDTTLIVLITAALFSLGIGIWDDPAKGWIEGAAILFAVLLVAVVTATNNYRKEAQFRKLNAIKDDIDVTVIRNGEVISISTKELVVGDIVQLNAGDKIPADGIMVSGSEVSCNESSLTGEPEDRHKSVDKPCKEGGDPFMLSGTSVSNGFCQMVVVAVGDNSRWGRTKAKLVQESVDTPLQEKLDTLAGQIGYVGMGAAAATFIAMMFIYYSHPEHRAKNSHGEAESIYTFVLKAFLMCVTIVVVAVPEGLPLAVTLSLAYSTQKMMQDNNLIRVLAACETMGNATNVCSDKTGTLTTNRMTVVEGVIAGRDLNEGGVAAPVIELIAEGISHNTTANIIPGQNPAVNPDGEVLGNKTEGALLIFLGKYLKQDYRTRRVGFDARRGDRMLTFTSERKRMSTLLVPGRRSCVLYCKGAAEVMLTRCTSYTQPDGTAAPLDVVTREKMKSLISGMAKNALRTVAIAHRPFPSCPKANVDADELEQDMCLDAVFGIKDPLRPDVVEAVQRCQEAGIFVRMVTGDNIETANAIARECGILTEGGVSMEGPAFRRLTPKQLDEVLPQLQVLARSSPSDKHTLVTRLNGHNLPENEEEWKAAHPLSRWSDRDKILPGYKEEWLSSESRPNGVGEVVGVTGDGTNDGPALKAADVGLSMGLSGTDVAKEASDIVIMDDNFSSIVKAVMWGRSVFDNIRKFLQFQLTVNMVALTLTFVSAVTGYEPPLNAVMMLWVNLIMDTMGALALGTEPPSPTLLSRRPYRRDAPLISNLMWRNVAVQSLFQIALLSYLLMIGAQDFGSIHNSREHFTVVFNTFVFCQIFNEFNARSIGNEMNIFKGLFRNPIFLIIILITVVSQYFLVEFGGDFVKTTSLNADQWRKCITLASLTLPLGALMRLIPVYESSRDFAEVSPLIASHLSTRRKADALGSKGESIFSLSFIVWIALVGAVPAVLYQEFAEDWVRHYPVILSAVQKFFSPK